MARQEEQGVTDECDGSSGRKVVQEKLRNWGEELIASSVEKAKRPEEEEERQPGPGVEDELPATVGKEILASCCR
jgi:hypothetical protein